MEKHILDELPEHFKLASNEVDLAHEESIVVSRQATREITIEHRTINVSKQPQLVQIEYILDEQNKHIFVNFKNIYHQLKLDYNVTE